MKNIWRVSWTSARRRASSSSVFSLIEADGKRNYPVFDWDSRNAEGVIPFSVLNAKLNDDRDV